MRRQSSHGTGVELVESELKARGYTTSLDKNRSGVDLFAGKAGKNFTVTVSSVWRSGTTWWPTKKPLRPDNFCVLVAVGEEGEASRFFVLSQRELNDLIDRYQSEHPQQQEVGGFSWPYALPFEDNWSILPE